MRIIEREIIVCVVVGKINGKNISLPSIFTTTQLFDYPYLLYSIHFHSAALLPQLGELPLSLSHKHSLSFFVVHILVYTCSKAPVKKTLDNRHSTQTQQAQIKIKRQISLTQLMPTQMKKLKSLQPFQYCPQSSPFKADRFSFSLSLDFR